MSTILGQSPNKNLPEPEIGKPCPEFVFNNIDFYKDKQLKLSDLKGKWVVLDFWSRGCSSCVSNLPKISKEQIEFGDSVKFIMVGPDSRPDDRQLYTEYHRKLNLTMPSAFDSELAKSFNVGLLPHVLIIDPNGIVKAITTYPNPVKLRELMKGGNPIFTSPGYANHKTQLNSFKYDRKVPYLVAGNGGNDSNFLYRSLLTKWQPGNPRIVQNMKGIFRIDRLEVLGGSIEQLYLTAYFGNDNIDREDSVLYSAYYRAPIFEIKDTSLLKPERSSGKNVFCYSLNVPLEKASKKYLMQIMQSDLKNYFNYEVSIETREVPYWKLIATNEAKHNLRSKGGPTKIDRLANHAAWSGLSLKNCPMSKVAYLVERYAEVTNNNSSLLDETGITTNIDIDLDWAKGDYNVVRKALQKNGLDLIPGKRKVKCLVVKDSKEENNLAELKN